MSELEKTLQQRGARYGVFTHNAAVAQGLKRVIHNSPNWSTLRDDQREALGMIAAKISRIMTGDPDYADNWHDIAGFAALVEKRLNEEGQNESN